MTRVRVRATRLLAGAAIVFAGSVAAQAAHGAAQVPSVQTEEEFAKAGEQLMNKSCDTSCHGLEKLDEAGRKPPREWDDLVISMQGKGATGTAADFAVVKKYLARYYGFVRVNMAAAEEFSRVLGLSAKDAAAVVAYRTEHGKFADIEALLKVPAIDKSKIEEQPDALRFN